MPPNRCADVYAPAAEYFAVNTSVEPALVSVAPPKVALPENDPAATMLPLRSTAAAIP